MSYFKRKMVRESLSESSIDEVGLDIIDTETDVDGALLEVENDTQEIANMDIEAEVMDGDIAETEDRMEALGDESEDDASEDISEGEMEQLDVAQEHIRNRWGFRHTSVARESLGSPKMRRKIARESLWEDIKAFFRRMREWFEEKLAQLKDRWLKFHNAGKTIQKKSKKFDTAIQKLGEKDKDTISGGWIESCTVNGAVNIDVLVFSDVVKAGEASEQIATLQKRVTTAAEEAAKNAKTDGKPAGESTAGADQTKKEADEIIQAIAGKLSQNQPGNYYFGISKDGESADIVFEKIEDAEVPSEVNTPSVAQLNKANTQYNRLGIELEKYLQAWKKNENAREAVAKGLKKVEEAIDKAESASAEMSAHRSTLSSLRGAVSELDKVQAHVIKCATKGLNGYITAGIRAYKKKK